jgi:hypothetical protein
MARPGSWRRAAAAVVVVILLAASIGGDRWRSDQAPAEVPARSPQTARITSTTTRTQHPLVVLVDRYDRLYAEIIGNADILRNPSHEAHRRMAALLTPDSPLQPTILVGAGQQDFYNSWPGSTQHAGGTRPELLPPGAGNARLPMVHELLGDLPTGGDTAAVGSCVHLDYHVVNALGQWVELAWDIELPGHVTFRRVAGDWRIHDYRWTWDARCQRSGPEPPGTAHHPPGSPPGYP